MMNRSCPRVALLVALFVLVMSVPAAVQRMLVFAIVPDLNIWLSPDSAEKTTILTYLQHRVSTTVTGEAFEVDDEIFVPIEIMLSGAAG